MWLNYNLPFLIKYTIDKLLFLKICFLLKDVIKIVRRLLASVNVNRLRLKQAFFVNASNAIYAFVVKLI